MIQRIQTVYLLMAATCMAFMHLLPLAHITRPGVGGISEEASMGLYSVSDGLPCVDCTNYGAPYLTGLVVVSLVLSIFLYSNRIRQIRVIGVSIVVMAVAAALLLLYYRQVHSSYPSGMQAGIPLFFPLPAAVLAWLAARAVRKDEAMVKAADRLR